MESESNPISYQSEGENPNYAPSTASAAGIVSILKDEYTKMINSKEIDHYTVEDRLIILPDPSKKIDDIKSDNDIVVYLRDQSAKLPGYLEVYFVCDIIGLVSFFDTFKSDKPTRPLMIVFNGTDRAEARELCEKNLPKMNQKLMAAIWLSYSDYPELKNRFFLEHQVACHREVIAELNRAPYEKTIEIGEKEKEMAVLREKKKEKWKKRKEKLQS